MQLGSHRPVGLESDLGYCAPIPGYFLGFGSLASKVGTATDLVPGKGSLASCQVVAFSGVL